ncbi:unnamed protein product [Dicrocoelium dendriticum]|nr:unnamed protein product [Dicrocoelium dendriticum]
MSDGEYITDGPLLDLADLDWREDIIPFEHILIQPYCLPDPEPSLSDKPQVPDSVLPESAADIRLAELNLETLLLDANPCLPAPYPLSVHPTL